MRPDRDQNRGYWPIYPEDGVGHIQVVLLPRGNITPWRHTRRIIGFILFQPAFAGTLLELICTGWDLLLASDTGLLYERPSVCLISSGFPSPQIILDNCPAHQPSRGIQWFRLPPQGLFNSLANVCFLLAIGFCFVCLISVSRNEGKHPAGCQF